MSGGGWRGVGGGLFPVGKVGVGRGNRSAVTSCRPAWFLALVTLSVRCVTGGQRT